MKDAPESTDGYEPVYFKNESLAGGKHKKGDKLTFTVTEVMDDGVKAVCSHRGKATPPENERKEMAENMTGRYAEKMNEGAVV